MKPSTKAQMGRPDAFPTVDPDFAAAVGYVAIAWAHVECAVGRLAKNLLKLEAQAGLALVAEIPFLPLANLVTVLTDLAIHDEIADEWRNVLYDVNRLRSIRNLIVHGDWINRGGKNKICKNKAKQKLLPKYMEFSVEDLMNIATECIDLADWIGRVRVITLERGLIPRIHESDAVVRTEWQQEREQLRIQSRSLKTESRNLRPKQTISSWARKHALKEEDDRL